MRPPPTVLVLAIALGACGPAAAPPSLLGSDGAVEVIVEDFAYSPARLEVPAGSTVTWTNADDVAHTVTSGVPGAPDGAFDEPLGRPDQHDAAGATASVALEGPGTYVYSCSLHPSMAGTIVVTTP